MSIEELKQHIATMEKQRDDGLATFHQATGALLALQMILGKMEKDAKSNAEL